MTDRSKSAGGSRPFGSAGAGDAPSKPPTADTPPIREQGPNREQGPPQLEIGELIRAYHADLYRYAFRLCGSVPDAEDLTQQAFLTAQQKLHQVRDPATARAWLYTVLRSCFLKSRRKNRPLTATGADLSVDEIPEEAAGDDGVDRQRLQAALDSLPDEFRLVVLMFYFEDFSYKQIAAELDIPIGTVMSRLARAKGRLRHWLLEAERREQVGRGATPGKQTGPDETGPEETGPEQTDPEQENGGAERTERSPAPSNETAASRRSSR